MTRPPRTLDPRLARSLREIRHRTGLAGYVVAGKTGWSESKVSRIERTKTPVSVADVEMLCDIYEVTGGERDALISMAAAEQRRVSSSAAYRDQATAADIWAPSLIPPALRTPGYAQAVAGSVQDITGALPSEVANAGMLDAREWQKRIETRRYPLTVRAVLDVTALRRVPGDATTAVMRGQAEYLAGLDVWPNVTLTVLRPDMGGPAGLAAFTLLRFNDGTRRGDDVAMFDDPAAPRLADAEAVTWHCTRCFRELAALAEPPAGALAAALAHWSR